MGSRTSRRVMVIGGASLVGSHLCERLLDRGDEVIAVDDLTSGSFATLAHLRGRPRFSFVEHDVRAQITSRKLDAIFHLAIPSSRRAYESDPVRSTLTSVVGTHHALELATDHDARVVLATSPERWGHGVRCAETLVVELTKARGLDTRIVRVASAYGPRMPADDPHVVMRLVREAVRGEAPSRASDAVHRLTYVDDAVETLVRTLDADLRIPAVAAPAVVTTASSIARAVFEAAGRSSPEDAATSMVDTAPSTTSTRTTPEALPASVVFGQPAPVPLREGIERTVRWFEARHAAVFAKAPPRVSGIYGVAPPQAATASKSQ